MVDLKSLVLLMSIFGWRVAIVYVVLGLVIAVAGGTLIEKLHLEEQVEAFIRNGHAMDVPQEELHCKDRMQYAWEQVVSTAKKVAPYVLIGVVLSFMMGVTTLSLPSMIMLRKAVKPKLLGIFAAICTMGIIIVGYFFHAIQNLIL